MNTRMRLAVSLRVHGAEVRVVLGEMLMKKAVLITVVLGLTCLGSVAKADAPGIDCVGTESGGNGPRLYAYDVDSTSYPMMGFRVGTNDLDPGRYTNLLVPEGWSFALEPAPTAHAHGWKTPHGEYSPGPCFCLPAGSAYWWTDDPERAVEFFTFGYDHPWASEDVGWALETRREDTPPQLHTFVESWQSPVGTGLGPVHGPGTDPQWATTTYAFVPGQSHVIQTGGFAGVHETYGVAGQFRLTVDHHAGVASFDTVEATVSGGAFLPQDYQDLNTLFDMTALVSTAVSETVIEMATEEPLPGGKVVSLTLDLSGDSMHLTGGFCEPWADGFCYALDAIAIAIEPLRGDLDGDGVVGQTDLDAVLADWGHSPPILPYTDPSGDGLVSQADLDIVLGDWGDSIVFTQTAPLPEPATLGTFALGGLALLRRKGRSR